MLRASGVNTGGYRGRSLSHVSLGAAATVSKAYFQHHTAISQGDERLHPNEANLIVICDSTAHDERVGGTSADVAYGVSPVLWEIGCCGRELRLLREVQSYLWCLSNYLPVPPRLQCAWDAFYGQYCNLVKHAVTSAWGAWRPVCMLDDAIQEVWRELLRALRKLVYEPSRGSLATWLVSVVRRTVRRLAKSFKSLKLEHRCTIESAATALYSHHPGPEDAYAEAELRERIQSLVADYRQRMSPQNYEVFRRWFLEGQSPGDIAKATGLTRKAVYRRCARLKTLCPELTAIRAKYWVRLDVDI